MGTEEKPNNGSQVVVTITTKDVWMKVNQLEAKVDALSIKLYAFATAVIIISGFLTLAGGVRIGG